MAGGGDAGAAAMNAAALARRQALAGPSGPAGLMQNLKVFGIAMFACLGGYVFSLRFASLYDHQYSIINMAWLGWSMVTIRFAFHSDDTFNRRDSLAN